MTEDIKNEPEIEAGPDNENKRETYPVKTFKTVEGFVTNIYKKYGDTETVSNQKAADANNLAANSIKQLLSTSQQYSVLRNIHGKGYRVTETFTKIYHPENDDEKKMLVVECLQNVKFYKQLFKDYADKAVPALEGLKNRFMREHKMKEHIAKNAAEIFLKNLKDFELLNSRNILILPSINESRIGKNGENEDAGNDTKKKNAESNHNGEDEQQPGMVKIPIRLKSGAMASLSFPENFSDDDLIRIFKVLKAYISAYGENIKIEEL